MTIRTIPTPETDRAVIAMALLTATLAGDEQTVQEVLKNDDRYLLDGMLAVAAAMTFETYPNLVETLRTGTTDEAARYYQRHAEAAD